MKNDASSFWDHLEELRRTLVKILFVVGLGFVLSLAFHDLIIEFVTLPLRSTTHSRVFHPDLVRETVYRQRIRNSSGSSVSFSLDETYGHVVKNSPLIQQEGHGRYVIEPNGYLEVEMVDIPSMLFLFGPLEGITSALRLCLWSGLALTSPLWMFFLLRFVGPGLRHRERRIIIPFFSASILFLIGGIFFSLAVMIPIANQVLYSFNSALGQNLWGVGAYLNYTVILMLGNGIAFEGVVIIAFLVHYGLIKAATMRSQRRVVVVGIFVLSAILTPPDILTQCLLALPLVALFELAIVYASFREFLEQRKACPA